MKKPTKEAVYLMIGSIYGALIGLAANLLYSDINNKWSWFMFIVTMIINFVLIRWLLILFYKITSPRKKK